MIENGRIAELGSHAQLVALGGLYAGLERAQSRREHLMQDLDEPETKTETKPISAEAP